MATTAEAYGFGARAPYAQPRESEYDMKERVRLSGLFPRVRNQPMSVQLQALLKDFEKNSALAGILERRRRMEEKTQYDLRSREAMAAMNTNLAPPFRTGHASFATSAAVASKVADAPVPDAADLMTGAVGKTATAAAKEKAKEKAKAERAAKAKAKAEAAAAAKAAAEASEVILGNVSLQGNSVSSTDPLSPAVPRRPAPKTPPVARNTRSPSTSRFKAR